jgi:hypothetical protein
VPVVEVMLLLPGHQGLLEALQSPAVHRDVQGGAAAAAAVAGGHFQWHHRLPRKL